MHAHLLGDVRHGERTQFGRAVFEEVSLTFDDDVGELLDGALAFLDGADKELALPHALEDVGALLVAEGLAGEHVLVSRDEAEARDVAVVHDDLPLAVFVELHGGVGRNHAVVVTGESAGRHGLELSEFGKRLADVIQFDVEHAGTFFEPAAHHGLPAVGDKTRGGRKAPAALTQLGEEAFAEIAGTDAGRIEGHQQRMRRHDRLVRLAGTQSDGRKVFFDEATLVERGNQQLECFLYRWIIGSRASLVGEVFGKGCLARGGFQHMTATLFIFLRVALGADLLVIAFIPILLHALQRVKIVISQGEFARTLLFRLLGGHGRVQTLVTGRLDFFE